MTDLHSLPKIVDKKKKRLGRGYGSRRGAKSGRGTTRHQKARTNIPVWFEGGQNTITKKFPLLRGKGKNKSVKDKPMPVNVDKLNKLKKNTTVTVDTLIEHKIVDKKAASKGVKILGRGDITVALTVELPASASAQKKIKDAGGSVASS